jgi:hypothetical protein
MNDDALIDGILTLKKVLRRERIKKLLVANIAIASGLALSWGAYIANEHTVTLFVILSMIVWVVALRFSYSIWKEWKIDRSPLLVLLHQSPQMFVWIYTIRVEVMPFGIQFWNEDTLVFRLTNKMEFQLRAKNSEIEKIRAALVLLLPHASFGYSKEKEQWYMANPLLLMNNGEE